MLLWGETRLGKTLWARSLGNHLYFGGLFNMSEVDDALDEAKFAIFDDMQGEFEFFHGYKFWLGAQTDFNITDKYKGKKRINWGRPSIWLSNNDPTTLKGLDYDWLIGNCDVIHLQESIISRASM